MPDHDAQRDAAALVRAVLAGDREAAAVILDNGDLRDIAVQVATLAGIALSSWLGSDTEAAEYLAWMQQQLAEADR